MGVTYKLRDEVVQFIIRQRQDNPLFSCRQLAESASARFGVHLSKSSVHDVLKESGIVTPRGRKPKDKFAIPQEKKKQIQANLSQTNLLPLPIEPLPLPVAVEQEGAGKIFQKAVWWDLGIFQEHIKESDWKYYLTYTKGLKVVLQKDQEFFIELRLPIERCIKEVADCLVNNTKPFISDKVSDEEGFKACMEGREGCQIEKIIIVDQKDHEVMIFEHIVVIKRNYFIKNRLFVENMSQNVSERLKSIFFPQDTDKYELIENILDLKGFDSFSPEELIVTLVMESGYIKKNSLQEAVAIFNRMYLRDEEGRLVKILLAG